MTVVARERRAKDASMILESGAVAVSTKFAQQPCRPFDVGEQEGNGPARAFRHASSVPAHRLPAGGPTPAHPRAARGALASGQMTSRRAAILAWSLAGLILVVVATTAVLVFLNRDSIHNIDEANLIEIVLPIGFAFVGGLVASRLPANPLGCVFLAISLCNALPGTTIQYTRYAFATHPGAPFTAWIPWFGNLTDSFVYPAGLATRALLRIPNGRFLSDRWRLVAWAGTVLTAALLVTTMLDPELISGQGPVRIANP